MGYTTCGIHLQTLSLLAGSGGVATLEGIKMDSITNTSIQITLHVLHKISPVARKFIYISQCLKLELANTDVMVECPPGRVFVKDTRWRLLKSVLIDN